jgi:hypothetical protein
VVSLPSPLIACLPQVSLRSVALPASISGEQAGVEGSKRGLVDTIVISYYSDVGGRDYYTRSAHRLRDRLDALRVPYDIRHRPSLGSYRANCLAKPGYILERLEETQAPLVWLDVDSIVYRPLDAFDELAGTGVDVGVASATGDPLDLQSSPLFFGYTSGARELLAAWRESAEHLLVSERTAFDHEALLAVFPRLTGQLDIRVLGPEYCAWPGRRQANTVIEMGLTDDPEKAEVLRAMGHSEALITLETPGLLTENGEPNGE